MSDPIRYDDLRGDAVLQGGARHRQQSRRSTGKP